MSTVENVRVGIGASGLRIGVVPTFNHLKPVLNTWVAKPMADADDAETDSEGYIDSLSGYNQREQVTFTTWLKESLPVTQLEGYDRIQVDGEFTADGEDRIYVIDPEGVTPEVYRHGKPVKVQITMTWYPRVDAAQTTSTRPLIT